MVSGMKKPPKGKQRQAKPKKRVRDQGPFKPSRRTISGNDRSGRYELQFQEGSASPEKLRYVQRLLSSQLGRAWADIFRDAKQLYMRIGESLSALPMLLREIEAIPDGTSTIAALRAIRSVINFTSQMEEFTPEEVQRLAVQIHRWANKSTLSSLPWDFVVLLCDKLVYALLAYDAERTEADWELAEYCARLALALMEKHARVDPHLPDSVDQLGTVLLNHRNTNRVPRLREAEQLFKTNLELAPRHSAFHEHKRALLNLGILNQELAKQEPGRLQQAIDYFDQLEELNERIEPEERLREQVLTNRGWARVQLPRDQQPEGCRRAIVDLQRAVAMCRQGHHHPSALAHALLHLGIAQEQLCEYEPAQREPAFRSLLEAKALYEHLQNSDGYSRAVHSLGLLHARAGDHERALANNLEALKTRQGRAIEEWETWGNIVDVRVQPDMPPFASREGDQALLDKFKELAIQLKEHGDPERALRAHYYGLQLLGHDPPSDMDMVTVDWAERAIAEAESVWSATASEPMVRYHLGRWLGTFYAARMLIGIRRRENVDVLLRFAQNGKARTLILERQGESAAPPLLVDSAALLKRLEQIPGSAFIEIGVSSLGTAALVASLNRDGTLNVQTKALDMREEELVGLLTKPGKGWQWHIEALRSADDVSQIDRLEACAAGMEHILGILYERLLGPVTAGLRSQGVQDLVFAVHGPLAAFPLAAAWRAVDGEVRYLIEDFRSISLTPSVTSFVYSEQPRPLSECQYIVGDTRTLPKEAGRDGLHLESIWRRSAQAIPSLKSPAPEEFLRSLEQADLVHAVCHGEFDPWRLDRSGIQVGGDALLSCERLLTDPNSKRTAMVVLCACRSGRSRSEDFGADWLGLSGVLLRRGVQAVLAALWDVDYAASFRMSCAFYEHLFGRNQPAAIAASLAMRDILQAGRAAKRSDAAHWFLDGREAKIIPRLRSLLDSPWLWACMQFVSVESS